MVPDCIFAWGLTVAEQKNPLSAYSALEGEELVSENLTRRVPCHCWSHHPCVVVVPSTWSVRIGSVGEK